VKIKRLASSPVVPAPLVPTMIVLTVFVVEAKFVVSRQPEIQVIPSDETDKVPDKGPVVPSLLLYNPVNVPSGWIVSLALSHEEADPADKTLPSQAPAKSANAYEAGWYVRIVRFVEPSCDHVAVHVIKVLLESIQQLAALDWPFRVITIPLATIEKEPLRLAVLPLLSIPEPLKVPF